MGKDCNNFITQRVIKLLQACQFICSIFLSILLPFVPVCTSPTKICRLKDCELLKLIFFFLNLCFQLKNLDFEELQLRLSALDPMMEREIEELRQRYTAKRQPILDAMDAKKRRQQNF